MALSVLLLLRNYNYIHFDCLNIRMCSVLNYFQLFIGEFSTAIKKSGLHLGLYHSLYEWFNPLYMKDKANNFTTKEFVKVKNILLVDHCINLSMMDNCKNACSFCYY